MLYRFLDLLMLFLGQGLRPFVPFLRERYAFERKNREEVHCRSFKIDDVAAKFCFAVSSEGELEQSRYLIEYWLQQGEKIELCFTSPSVEKKAIQLARLYPDHLRILRNPILSIPRFSTWATASTLILCRYDFFPVFFFYGTLPLKRMILIQGSLNRKWKKLERNLLLRMLTQWIYQHFAVIITSTEFEARRFESFLFPPGPKIAAYEFRLPQILKRLQQKKISLSPYGALTTALDSSAIPVVMFGNLWPHEVDLFSFDYGPFRQTHLPVLIPHQLSEEMAAEFKLKFQALGLELVFITAETSLEAIQAVMKNERQVLVIWIKGILLELYTYADKVYVGNGFHYSVHSLLEPYCAEAMLVSGPLIERSTEAQWVLDQKDQSYSVVATKSEVLGTLTHLPKLSPSLRFKKLARYERIFASTLMYFE